MLEWNPASCRVLEKAGFAAEARLHKAAFKDGQLVDTWLYARLRGLTVSASISASVRPASRSTSAVCSPSRGGRRRRLGGASR